ncbi:jg15218 [Pararge aegeria aegeria]|uniref:Jg15218 protein n=1 Tax=Pararge aegeria aegeria TaxID=348720 RepID=A0A8S4QEN2_9NEOP|nr:jg15218 [Pararge aegeria aegeria]
MLGTDLGLPETETEVLTTRPSLLLHHRLKMLHLNYLLSAKAIVNYQTNNVRVLHIKACMEADETPTHVLLQCRGVAEQHAAYLGSPASVPEGLGDLGGLQSFWSELGWLE